MEEVEATIHQLHHSNKESEQMLQESNVKINELKREVEECNRGLDESSKKEKEHQMWIVRCE